MSNTTIEEIRNEAFDATYSLELGVGGKITSIKNANVFYGFCLSANLSNRVESVKKFLAFLVSSTTAEMKAGAARIVRGEEPESEWMVKQFCIFMVENKNYIVESCEIFFISRFFQLAYFLSLAEDGDGTNADAAADAAGIKEYPILWPQFDLPPGIGKTYQMKKVCRLFDEDDSPPQKCVICCPTAKAALLYDKASTVHSKFRVPIGTARNWAARRSFSIDKGVWDAVGGSNYFIFDEFSMTPEYIFDEVLESLHRKRKFVLLAGDSCQFQPIMAKMYDFDKIKARISAGELTGFLVRFECAMPSITLGDGDSDDDRVQVKNCQASMAMPNLRRFEGPLKDEHIQFIMLIRSLIKFRQCNKNLQTFTIDPQSLEFWASIFCKLFTVKEHTITGEEIFDKQMLGVQRRSLQTLGQFDFDLEAIDDMLQGAPKTTIPVSECSFEKIPMAISYFNATADRFQNEMYRLLKPEFDSVAAAAAAAKSAAKSSSAASAPFTFSNVFVTRKSLDESPWDVLQFMESLPPQISSANNVIKVGSYVMCRRNDSGSGDYNGMQGIVVGYKVDCRFEDYTCETVNISRPNNDKQVFSVVKVDCPDSRFKFDSADFAVRLFVYDTTEQCIRISSARQVMLCKNCEADTCMQHTGAAAKSAAAAKVVFWHTMYSVTLHNIQGVTLNSGEIFCITKEVMASKRLTSMYILLSRAAHSKDIVMDREFVFQSIRAIFMDTQQTTFMNKIKRVLAVADVEKTRLLRFICDEAVLARLEPEPPAVKLPAAKSSKAAGVAVAAAVKRGVGKGVAKRAPKNQKRGRKRKIASSAAV